MTPSSILNFQHYRIKKLFAEMSDRKTTNLAALFFGFGFCIDSAALGLKHTKNLANSIHWKGVQNCLQRNIA